MVIESSQPPPRRDAPRTEDETILESSLESFPASDPPAWVSGKDVAPVRRSTVRGQGEEARSKGEGWFKRTLRRLMGRARTLTGVDSDKPSSGEPR